MKTSVPFEVRRQAGHFFGVVYIVLSFFLSFSHLVLILFLSLFVAASAYRLTHVLKKIPIAGGFFEKCYSCARKNEQKVGMYLGSTSFLLGLILVLIIFNSIEIFQIAALVLAFGDSFSTVAGKSFGRHKLFFNPKKSLEGTSVGFLAAFFALKFLGVDALLSAILAATGMLVEALPMKINDNLTIPLVVGFVAWLLI